MCEGKKQGKMHTINAALVALCGCLQMIIIMRMSRSMITEIQSRLHHFRACRESRAPDMKRLRMIAKKTEENNNFSDCKQRKSSTNKMYKDDSRITY